MITVDWTPTGEIAQPFQGTRQTQQRLHLSCLVRVSTYAPRTCPSLSLVPDFRAHPARRYCLDTQVP
ncbi:hypothetical protein PC119_g12086 [Phytophthora cactorum]|nr:hypothetical protein PC119_g12086 [Phytophthora cactorum]